VRIIVRTPAAKPSNVNSYQEYRDCPEQAVQPVSDAKTDGQSDHKFDDHPPRSPRRAVMVMVPPTRVPVRFRSVDAGPGALPKPLDRVRPASQ